MYQLNVSFMALQEDSYWIIHTPLWFTGYDHDTIDTCVLTAGNNAQLNMNKISLQTMDCLISIPHAQMDDNMWINRWIKPLVDKDSLFEIKDNLTCFSELSFYTDGSIQNRVPYHLRKPLDECLEHHSMVINQGAAFVKIHSNQQFFTCIVNWPKFHSRGFNNSLILIYTDILIKNRKLDIELIKVKAHAGDPWNELADDLVKKGTELLTHHQLTFNFRSQGYRFSPHFEEILIEQKLRNFLNAMGQVQACSEWRDLQVNTDAFTQRSQQYQWVEVRFVDDLSGYTSGYADRWIAIYIHR
ncbi:hypothetical protein RclHR1_18650001 [Rhizophagus clarus]|uniref:Uncharacterized protein n=1 Tax=Rhizophagus clarus TaxID=94130 RepID=A0A2Z6QP96_9GLOM|nr:hypothetical protein RclHR1_18650001 [Rhizophagus clarus]